MTGSMIGNMIGNMTVLAILQARYSSTRLPGKVMKPILGKPMLAQQIARVRLARRVDALVVATSTEASDQPIEDLCQSLGVGCHRGSLNDVLDRFYGAAVKSRPAHVVRLTGDCPLTDPAVIDLVIDEHLTSHADYTSNALEPTFPDGLDVEVVKFAALERAHREAALTSEREHVTPYLYKHPEIFSIRSVKAAVDLSKLRWTVDEPRDFAFVTEIYNRLGDSRAFGLQEVLDLLRREPELAQLNGSIDRNEGYSLSLTRDQQAKG